ncbi:MAG: hypothetical protein N4J56_002808 [Chroococcidiopsis sp. SAG 2025]|nr:hypothetical protein [Chroococcidiopsis sp. SAG 2025]
MTISVCPFSAFMQTLYLIRSNKLLYLYSKYFTNMALVKLLSDRKSQGITYLKLEISIPLPPFLREE